MPRVSASTIAARIGVSKRRVQYLCSTGRIAGARKVLGQWRIPEETNIAPGKRGPRGSSW